MYNYTIISIPILIPARNEELHIGRALRSLPRNVEPIVLANGSTDATVAIAESFGVEVLELPEGKLPSLQFGIRHLGKRATEPFITLDADSAPVFPKLWAKALVNSLKQLPDSPSIVVGPNIFTEGPGFIADTHLSLQFNWKQMRTRHENFQGRFTGRNMLIRTFDTETTEELLSLDNYWPGEDYAIRDTIVERGGSTYKTQNIFASVVTDAVRYPHISDALSQKKQPMLRKRLRQSYIDDCPPGAKRYFKLSDPTYKILNPQDLESNQGINSSDPESKV